jgi:MFS family permease
VAILALLAVSALLLFEAGEWGLVYLYVALFGTVFGAMMPMRAVVMSQHFGGALYGRLMGLRVTILALATAGGPFLAGLLWDLTSSQAVPWLVAAVMLGVATPLTLAVGRKPITPDARSSKWAED